MAIGKSGSAAFDIAAGVQVIPARRRPVRTYHMNACVDASLRKPLLRECLERGVSIADIIEPLLFEHLESGGFLER